METTVSLYGYYRCNLLEIIEAHIQPIQSSAAGAHHLICRVYQAFIRCHRCDVQFGNCCFSAPVCTRYAERQQAYSMQMEVPLLVCC